MAFRFFISYSAGKLYDLLGFLTLFQLLEFREKLQKILELLLLVCYNAIVIDLTN